MRGAELLWKKKNGRHLVVHLPARVPHNAQGHVIGYEGMVLDVTERKRAEQERETVYQLAHDLSQRQINACERGESEVPLSLLLVITNRGYPLLALPNGIPSHDTFARVLARLDPEESQRCFLRWIEAVSEVTHAEVGAIDGKTLRRSFDRASRKGAIHMVSAWATANRLVLGQRRVDEKSNEITAIPAGSRSATCCLGWNRSSATSR